ncbi:MAG: ACP S-malonyltransferase [Chlamydiia bacterium]|nr:ACP S-malonyltransferase [Chlamydiia bacterium]
MKKIAFIFPGQGAQYVGMGKDFYESFSIVRETFQEADDRLGFSLTKLMFEGPADELTLTKNSQIAIYVMSVALYRVFTQEFPEMKPSAVAGLSLGEYTALTASGRLSFAEGIDLVRARGLYMHEAGLKNLGTMAVALGMTPEAVTEGIAPIDGVWVANLNCPGQVVISGTVPSVEKASALFKEKGAKRVLPLDVSGAFHSGLMEEAKEKLKEKIDEVSFLSSDIALVMNTIGDVAKEEEIRERLVEQVVSPVYWEKGVRALEESDVDLFIEIGPGKTLSGMNRKIGTKGKTLSVEKVGDLETISEGACNGTT